MDARNQEFEGDQQCAYVVHINNNTIRKESQSPIREVLARSCWKAGPGQEASDGSKVRREGKLGLLYPVKFGRKQDQRGQQRLQSRAHVVGRPQPSVRGQKCIRSGDDVYARAAMHAPRRERMRPGDNVYAHATTDAAWEGCFFTNTPNFSAWATTSASGRQRLRSGDDVWRLRS